METGRAYPNHLGYFDGLLWSGTKEKKQNEKNDCGILYATLDTDS
jgi:hypothetical protein